MRPAFARLLASGPGRLRARPSANLVGRGRMIAGADGGVAVLARFSAVHGEVARGRLEPPATGAAAASDRLWRKAAR